MLFGRLGRTSSLSSTQGIGLGREWLIKKRKIWSAKNSKRCSLDGANIKKGQLPIDWFALNFGLLPNARWKALDDVDWEKSSLLDGWRRPSSCFLSRCWPSCCFVPGRCRPSSCFLGRHQPFCCFVTGRHRPSYCFHHARQTFSAI